MEQIPQSISNPILKMSDLAEQVQIQNHAASIPTAKANRITVKNKIAAVAMPAKKVLGMAVGLAFLTSDPAVFVSPWPVDGVSIKRRLRGRLERSQATRVDASVIQDTEISHGDVYLQARHVENNESEDAKSAVNSAKTAEAQADAAALLRGRLTMVRSEETLDDLTDTHTEVESGMVYCKAASESHETESESDAEGPADETLPVASSREAGFRFNRPNEGRESTLEEAHRDWMLSNNLYEAEDEKSLEWILKIHRDIYLNWLEKQPHDDLRAQALTVKVDLQKHFAPGVPNPKAPGKTRKEIKDRIFANGSSCSCIFANPDEFDVWANGKYIYKPKI